MASIVHSVDIDRGADEVFAYVTEPPRFAEWQAAVVDAHGEGSRPLQKGSRLVMTPRMKCYKSAPSSANPSICCARNRRPRRDTRRRNQCREEGEFQSGTQVSTPRSRPSPVPSYRRSAAGDQNESRNDCARSVRDPGWTGPMPPLRTRREVVGSPPRG